MKCLIIIFVLLLARVAAAQTWQPDGEASWRQEADSNKHRIILGDPFHNYQKTDSSWAAIDTTWTLEGDSVLVNDKAVLKSRVNRQGVSTIRFKLGGEWYQVRQELLGIAWLKPATGQHQWIDSTMSWGGVSIDNNVVSWNNVSPGIDYAVVKRRGRLAHRISFKPGFLDAAVALYNQRPDSLEIALANVSVFTLSSNITDADSGLGIIDRREFKRIGRRSFGLIGQFLHFPDWHDWNLAPIQQYWKRVGNKLYAIEYVYMADIKAVHEAMPTETIWHNYDVSIQDGESGDDADNPGTFSITNDPVLVGVGGAYFLHRFDGATIDQGATIDTAVIDYQDCNDNSATTCNVTFACEDADDPVAFTTLGNYNSRSWTTASTDKVLSPGWSFAQHFQYTIDSAGWGSGPVQEQIDRPGFVSGNAIVVRCLNNGSTGAAVRGACAWDRTSSPRTTLNIDWTAGAPAGVTVGNYIHGPLKTQVHGADGASVLSVP